MRYAYWNHLFRWVSMALSTGVFIALFVVEPAVTRSALSPWLLVVPILIAYIQGLRYLSFRRTDVSTWSQIATWLLTPLAAVWMLFVLRPVAGTRWPPACALAGAPVNMVSRSSSLEQRSDLNSGWLFIAMGRV